MRSRHVVLLTAPTADVRLPPVYHEQRRATTPESTPVEVFIPGDLNLFRISADVGRPHLAQFWCNASPFRINTCKSVSKQTTSTPFRMNTYEKRGRGVQLLLTRIPKARFGNAKRPPDVPVRGDLSSTNHAPPVPEHHPRHTHPPMPQSAPSTPPAIPRPSTVTP